MGEWVHTARLCTDVDDEENEGGLGALLVVGLVCGCVVVLGLSVCIVVGGCVMCVVVDVTGTDDFHEIPDENGEIAVCLLPYVAVETVDWP